MLRVENDVTQPSAPQVSTRTGLRNLAVRTSLSTGRTASWVREGHRFVVRLPLVAEIVKAYDRDAREHAIAERELP